MPDAAVAKLVKGVPRWNVCQKSGHCSISFGLRAADCGLWTVRMVLEHASLLSQLAFSEHCDNDGRYDYPAAITVYWPRMKQATKIVPAPPGEYAR